MRLHLINRAKVRQKHSLRAQSQNAVQAGIPVFEVQIRRWRWWADQRWVFQSYARYVTRKEQLAPLIKERYVMYRMPRHVKHPQFARPNGDLVAIIHDM